MRAALIAALVAQVVTAQSRVPPSRANLLARYFEPRQNEEKVRCDVIPIKPQMGFSLRFQTGWVARVPLEQYEGANHRWTVAVRITPGGKQPVYLVQRFRLPAIPKTKVYGQISGGCMLGEGRYDVSWVLMDEQQRVFRKQWQVEAKLRGRERNLKPAIPPATVNEFSLTAHRPQRELADPPLRLTVLLHAAPIVPSRSTLRLDDLFMLVGMLDSMLEQLPVESVRLVAFNLDQQKELFRQDDFTGKELDDLLQAIGGLQLGTVDYNILRNRRGDMDLLESLVADEFKDPSPGHVVVFLGARARPGENRPRTLMDAAPASAARFYYLQYSPLVFSWGGMNGTVLRMNQRGAMPDAINLMVSRLQGKTFSIWSAGELVKAITEIAHR